MDTLPDIPDIRCLEAHGYTVTHDSSFDWLPNNRYVEFVCQQCRHSVSRWLDPGRKDIPLGIMLMLLNHVRDIH